MALAQSKSNNDGEKSRNAFRTISEVADDLGVQQHVLRFWETKFNQIKPMKRGGGRRYYRPEDMDILRLIQHHLHNNGYTIRGVQKLFREKGLKTALKEFKNSQTSDSEQKSVPSVFSASPSDDQNSVAEIAANPEMIKALLAELKALRASLDN
jgi:DNA-binding transcriptional MerR regulator